MSKREGTIFELDELVKEIGIENYRYFMCYRKNDTHMDLDIDLIKKENNALVKKTIDQWREVMI